MHLQHAELSGLSRDRSVPAVLMPSAGISLIASSAVCGAHACRAMTHRGRTHDQDEISPPRFFASGRRCRGAIGGGTAYARARLSITPDYHARRVEHALWTRIRRVWKALRDGRDPSAAFEMPLHDEEPFTADLDEERHSPPKSRC